MAKDKWGSAFGQMARIADEGRAEREASKGHEAMRPKPDKGADPVVAETVSVPAPKVISETPKGSTTAVAAPTPVADMARKAPARAEAKVEPATVEEAPKAKKRSTSLYLSGAASRALNTLAAQQGVRPHRIIDDALRAEFRRHGLDFDTLNAKD